MPYRIHFDDRRAKVSKLADFITMVPEEELAGLLDEAKIALRNREFGSEHYGRNSGEHEPYWHESRLIADATKYISSGNPLEAFEYCLQEYNHGHSGFIDQSYRVYMHPYNDDERIVSQKIRQMIIDVSDALIRSNPLSYDMSAFGPGWMTITAIYQCLTMLGQDVPSDMVNQLRRLVGDCAQFADKNHEIEQLKHAMTRRFG